MNIHFWQIFSILVFIAGLFDAQKYVDLTRKIKRYSSSQSISRMFVNKAIIHKIILSIWAIFYLKDWAISLSTLIALYTSCELFYWTYYWYSYKYRNLINFKRPSIFKYFINSWEKNTKDNRL